MATAWRSTPRHTKHTKRALVVQLVTSCSSCGGECPSHSPTHHTISWHGTLSFSVTLHTIPLPVSPMIVYVSLHTLLMFTRSSLTPASAKHYSSLPPIRPACKHALHGSARGWNAGSAGRNRYG